MSDWPNKVRDLQEAQVIINQFAADDDDDSFQRVAIEVDSSSRKITIRPPEWMVEIARYFENKYGSDEGREVTRKVITACFLQLQEVTLH